MASTPDIIGGRYRVERRIGLGGMGELLLARDPSLKRQVAIKLLREDLEEGGGSSRLASELKQRFLNEAKAAAGLSHPNIVVIYDVVDDPHGRPFIVMEYVQGRTLGAIIDKGDPVDLATKLRLMEQLCDGLSCAHESELRIVHRDIKPANLMVDAQNNLKILDFGIARLADFHLTRADSQMGTPHYMAPEQFVGRGVDYRCDIWAVGAVFYEFLSFTRAFPGVDGLEHRVINQHPPALDTLPRCAGLDPRIVRVVNRALEKDPGRRFKNLKLMEAEIHEIRLSLGASATTQPPNAAALPGPSVATPIGTPPRTPPVTPVQPSDPDDLAGLLEQRASQIDTNLRVARQAVTASNFEGALRACNQVFFFDPKNPEAQAIAERARSGLDDNRVGELLATAQAELARGQVNEASRFADLAKALRPTSPTVVKVLVAIADARREAADRASRERAIDEYLAQAERALRVHDPQAALSAINHVLMLDRANLRGQTLQHEAYQVIEERQRDQDLNDRAAHAIESAREQFAAGQHLVALAMLEAFPTPTAALSEALAALQIEADKLARPETDRATAHVAAAREKFAAGLHQEAIADLERAAPTHPLISAGLTELRVRAGQYEREWDERESAVRRAAEAQARSQAERERPFETEDQSDSTQDITRPAGDFARRRPLAEAARVDSTDARANAAWQRSPVKASDRTRIFVGVGAAAAVIALVWIVSGRWSPQSTRSPASAQNASSPTTQGAETTGAGSVPPASPSIPAPSSPISAPAARDTSSLAGPPAAAHVGAARNGVGVQPAPPSIVAPVSSALAPTTREMSSNAAPSAAAQVGAARGGVGVQPAPPSIVAPSALSPASAALSVGGSLTLELDAQTVLEFVRIGAGRFAMGSENGAPYEKPVHEVTISRDFELGKYEVTQAQWTAVMGSNPSSFRSCGGSCPVEQVSWDDVQRFVAILNRRGDGYTYRLPTEAEWEYAARAGTAGEYAGILGEMAWYDENAGGTPHPVGKKRPNVWGLHDMHGNVLEWVSDSSASYTAGPITDPTGPSPSAIRVYRGGSWDLTSWGCRSALRYGSDPGFKFINLGFRLVRVRSSG